MNGLDHAIAQLAGGQTLVIALAVALLLGLRHATDPDHLAAVSTLIVSEPGDGRRQAGRLGLAWGLGHAATLSLFGLPVVVFGSSLPHTAQRAAEFVVGVLISVLALRLFLRWRRGRFHAHSHRHGAMEHRHLHPHADGAGHQHDHAHADRLGRSPAQAFGIGLVHGLGGSAGVGVLLIATIPDRVQAAGALLLFAAATAVSMASLSSLFGYALTRGQAPRQRLALAPGLSAVALVFGLYYAVSALPLGS